MKKIIAVAVAVLGFSAFVTNAEAGCDGIYLAARGGVVNHNLGNPSESLGTRYSVDDNLMFGSGAIGYRWGYFRIEGEYTWREKNEDKVEGSSFGAKTTFESQSYMANLYYDFSPYTMFTPYVMGGLGFSKLEFNFSNAFTSEKVKSTEFTWAVGGGISAKVTNRFNIDAGYRFLNMGKIQEATVRAHEVYLGLRYVF